MLDRTLVSFYRFWHGTLCLPGAGKLLSWAAGLDRGPQSFRLSIPTIGETTVDFRDNSAFYWLNFLLIVCFYPSNMEDRFPLASRTADRKISPHRLICRFMNR